MGGFFGFVIKNAPRIIQTVKFLFETYKKGHEAGLWSEDHEGVVTEKVVFGKAPTLGPTFGPFGPMH